jgi:hypothetical protein
MLRLLGLARRLLLGLMRGLMLWLVLMRRLGLRVLMCGLVLRLLRRRLLGLVTLMREYVLKTPFGRGQRYPPLLRLHRPTLSLLQRDERLR